MEIIIILALILINGILSMTEMAIVSTRRSWIEIEVKRKRRGAKDALKLIDNMDNFLSTVQIGITLVGILTGLFSGEKLSPFLSPYFVSFGMSQSLAYNISQTIIVALVTYLTLIFGELVPKRLGLTYSNAISCTFSQPMIVLSKLSVPFVWLLSKSTAFTFKFVGIEDDNKYNVTEEEIKEIIKEGTKTGEVGEVEEDIVGRVFSLGDRNIGSIMTHRHDIVCLNINEANSNIKHKVMENLYNVYPVIENGIDDIKGVIYLKDLFGQLDNPSFDIKSSLHKVHYFHEKLSVYNALKLFKKEQLKYAMVSDEFGGISGIVTMKDIVKALIGSVNEENNNPEIEEQANGSLIVDGQCSFYEFLHYINKEDLYNFYPFNTVGGLMLHHLEKIPQIGDNIQWNNISFTVTELDGLRIDKIIVGMTQEEEEDGEF
ncbi:MAG: hemolysin family protein [Bacteroidales bacterium]|nr:hemolysin family protein [Bacteroidales bacterium]